MGIVLNWNSTYPGSGIDDTISNFPTLTDAVHDVLVSHVNALANGLISVQTLLGVSNDTDFTTALGKLQFVTASTDGSGDVWRAEAEDGAGEPSIVALGDLDAIYGGNITGATLVAGDPLSATDFYAQLLVSQGCFGGWLQGIDPTDSTGAAIQFGNNGQSLAGGYEIDLQTLSPSSTNSSGISVGASNDNSDFGPVDGVNINSVVHVTTDNLRLSKQGSTETAGPIYFPFEQGRVLELSPGGLAIARHANGLLGTNVNQVAHGITVTNGVPVPVHFNGTTWEEAVNNTEPADAYCIRVSGVDDFEIVSHGLIPLGGGHGLSIGSHYWVHTVAGALNTSKPGTNPQYAGRVLQTSDGDFFNLYQERDPSI